MEKFRVVKAPNAAYYIPSFITEYEENEAIKNIYLAPKPKWVQLSNRRLQNWGGFPHAKGMIAETIPDWLQKHMHSIDELGVFGGRFSNHVLVNEYLPGQGIMPHEDGPLFHPTITTVNLGSHTMLDIYLPLEQQVSDQKILAQENSGLQKDSEELTMFHYQKVGSFLLEARSLLVLQDDLYIKYLHGIAERECDVTDESVFNVDMTNVSVGEVLKRDKRISLTIRHFPKVLKTNIFSSRFR